MAPITLDSCRQVLSKDETTDLMLWPVLRLATAEFLRRVHRVFFFNKGFSVLLMTRHIERVYALGSNKNGCLGVGSYDSLVTEPTEVRELRGKTLVQCASGDGFVMVLTNDGDLFGWGLNGSGQVGCGSQQRRIRRPVLVMQHVSTLACSSKHTAAVCQDGTVWCWGDNTHRQLGLDIQDKYLARARMVKGDLKGERVVQVDCASRITVALTDEAEVYHWGTFGFGNLVFNSPLLLSHSLSYDLTCVSVIAYDGETLFFLADNGYGFFGYYTDDPIDDNDFECDFHFYSQEAELCGPVQAVVNVGSKLCFKLYTGEVLIWKNDNKIHTRLTSMADARALYTSQQVMNGITIFPSDHITPSLMQSIGKFHNPADYDLKLDFNGKILLLNKNLTAQSSTYLAKQIEGSWSGNSVVIFTDYERYEVYFTFVRFVLTGTTGVVELRWVMQLLKLAVKSNTISLRDLCLHLMTKHMRTSISCYSFNNGIEQLMKSEYWPTELRPVDTILTMGNTFAGLGQEPDYCELDNKIWQRVAIQSLSTSFQVLKDLRALAGEPDPSEPVPLPESYLQWMIRHSNDTSLVILLQDPEHSSFFSDYLGNIVTRNNYFHYFRVALAASNEALQEHVVRFVASFDQVDHLLGLLISGDTEQVNHNQMKDLFTRILKFRTSSQRVSTKRLANSSSTESAPKRLH